MASEPDPKSADAPRRGFIRDVLSNSLGGIITAAAIAIATFVYQRLARSTAEELQAFVFTAAVVAALTGVAFAFAVAIRSVPRQVDRFVAYAGLACSLLLIVLFTIPFVGIFMS